MLRLKLIFRSKSAFTLIELLVVIAIIGLLVTLSVLALSNARVASRDSKRVADIKQMQSALELFYDANNRYPTNAEFQSGSIYSTSSDTGTSTYMGIIPAAPNPADGSCSDSQNAYVYNAPTDGSTYTLNFCVAKKINDLAAGRLVAIPGGIVGGCYNEADTQFCSRQSKNCGSFSGTDNCGQPRTADCGTCTGLETCKSGICGLTLAAMVYGGIGAESAAGLDMDDNYIYAVGSSASSPATGTDAVISKIDKMSLALVASKMYGGNSNDDFNKIFVDGNYIYTTGSTQSEGFGAIDAIIYKFDKNLNKIIGKVFGTAATNEYFRPMAADANYLYVLGQGYSNSKYDADIVKFNKNDLSIVAQKIYGAVSTDNDSYMQIALDDNYVYAVGNLQTTGFGGYDVLVTKFNKNDLSVVYSKIIGSIYDDSSSNDRLLVDDQYLYIPFYSSVKSSGVNNDAGLLKLDKNNLSIAAQVLCGGAQDEQRGRITFAGNYIYLHILTQSEGQGSYDYGLVKFDKNLTYISQKVFGTASSDSGNGLIYSDGYYYMHGMQSSKGAGNNDFTLLKFGDLPAGTYNTVPTGFVLADGNLTCQNTSLSIMDSNLTYQDINLSITTSTLMEKIPNWTITGPFIIQ